MRWRDDVPVLLTDLARACLIVAVAAFGATIVRNVTDALMGIAHRQPSIQENRRLAFDFSRHPELNLIVGRAPPP
jgi:hypothetical protein